MKRLSCMIAFSVVLTFLVCMLCGCGLFVSGEEVDEAAVLADSVENAIAGAGSVEASIFLEMQAHVGSAGTTTGHTASVESDITVSSTFSPLAYYAETYSRILVDSTSTREDSEVYVVPQDNKYVKYSYDVEGDAWTQQTLTLAEEEALSLKTCLIQDWAEFFRVAKREYEAVECNGKVADMYVGNVSATVLQEIFNDGIFGSFLFSVEQLLNDEVHCTVYIEQETYLPVQMVIDFSDSFIVSDMSFDAALITVDYAEWGASGDISVPKKVTVVASDPTAEFYASYYAWNLFLPYLQAATDNNNQGEGNLSFSSTWETFQIRIDNGMTTLPILYSDLAKLGYSIDSNFSTIIVEPNMYVADVPVYKGRDLVYCTFYNADTLALPITDCHIGCFDISSANVPQNGISVYLPGEVCLGVTKEFLISAYDNPDEIITGFSCDTYIWRIDGVENQSFMAEISPVNSQVIRMQLMYIPVTGGQQ